MYRVAIEGKGWAKAVDLVPGNALRSADNAVHAVRAVRNLGELPDQLVFNLNVGNVHTYLVFDGTADTLIHNASCNLNRHAKKAHRKRGVYGIRYNNGSYYVGKPKAIHRRMHQHDKKIKLNNVHSIRYHERSKGSLRKLEQGLCNRYKCYGGATLTNKIRASKSTLTADGEGGGDRDVPTPFFSFPGGVRMRISRRRDGWSEMVVTDEPWDPAYAELFEDGTCDGLVIGAPTRRRSGPAVDLSLLPDITGLRSLRILSGVPDLSPVTRCTGLVRLRLPASATRELDLSGLSELRELEAPWPVVARSLSALTSLDDLVMPGWKGASLSALGPKHTLRKLRLETSRNHVTDMEGAALFPALGELRLYDGRLAHSELLADAAALEDVSLLSAKTDAIAFVSGLPHLLRLELENSGDIASLAPVIDHPTLREVTVSGSTRVLDGDLSPLLDNPRLTSVAVERGHAHYSHTPCEVRKG